MRIKAAVAFCITALYCSATRADPGDWTLGVDAAYRFADGHHGVIGLGIIEWGFADFAALRFEGGPLYAVGDAPVRGDVGFGVTLQWDVLRLVPAVSITAGAQLADGQPSRARLGADIQLRYHLIEGLMVGLNAGVARLSEAWQLTAGLLLLKHF